MRTKFSLAIVAALVTASPALSGDVRIEEMPSELLSRNLPYAVYLPDGYESGDLDYPVLYLLHGGSNDESSWLAKGNIERILDELIADRAIPPMIAIMPGNTRSYWVDGKAQKAESSITDELIPHVDETYRTIANRKGRLLAGLSAGGYGTVNIGLKHADLFAAAAPLSPAIWTPLPSPDSGSRRYPQFAENGAFSEEFWQENNWPSHLESYKEAKTTLPFFIVSGDHDRLDITVEAAKFFQAMREIQRGDVELRVMDGDHEWDVWQAGITEALPYMVKYSSYPRKHSTTN